jgi:hypothetical protein
VLQQSPVYHRRAGTLHSNDEHWVSLQLASHGNPPKADLRATSTCLSSL